MTVKVENLAKGLKLVTTPVCEDPNAKKKVIKGYVYAIEGVPTEVERKVVTFTTVQNGVTVTESAAFEIVPNEYAGTSYAIQGYEYADSSLGAVLTIAAGGTAKLILTENTRKTTVTAKHADGTTWTCELVPTVDNYGILRFEGIATGKQGKVTRYGTAELSEVNMPE